MTSYVLTPPPQASVAVAGVRDRFPVRRVFCVGRNYAAHAKEMGGDASREPPFFFTKPADAVLDASPEERARVPYPPLTENLHHEVELAVAIRRGGARIPATDALAHVFGYGTAIDLTRRDLQAVAKKAGRPWDWAKAFDGSAPVSAIVPAAECGHPATGAIWLDVDGERRQEADLAEMIWPVPDIVAAASQSVTLAPGDLFLTGTPAGVGPLAPGQTVRAGIAGVGELVLTIDPGASG